MSDTKFELEGIKSLKFENVVVNGAAVPVPVATATPVQVP